MAEKNLEQEKPHTLLLDARKTARITGVTEVQSFDESCVVLSTVCGELTAEGEGLHISVLDIERGEVVIEGRVGSLLYTEAAPPRRSRFKGLFG